MQIWFLHHANWSKIVLLSRPSSLGRSCAPLNFFFVHDHAFFSIMEPTLTTFLSQSMNTSWGFHHKLAFSLTWSTLPSIIAFDGFQRTKFIGLPWKSRPKALYGRHFDDHCSRKLQSSAVIRSIGRAWAVMPHPNIILALINERAN